MKEAKQKFLNFFKKSKKNQDKENKDANLNIPS